MTKKERFVLWLNKLGRGCNRITIVVLYITIMIILGTLIYGANQQKATSNVTVNYSRPSYTVSFDPAGGGSSSSKIVKLGDNYGDLPTPTKTGYTFNGWQTSDGTAVTSTTQNTTIGDHTLTAIWTANIIKITLDKNGGTGGTSEFYYKYGTNIFYSDSSCSTQLTKPVLPTKQGYTLVHYYGDGTCGGSNGERYAGYADVSYGFASDLCTDIYQDATLYASWSAIATTISANYTSLAIPLRKIIGYGGTQLGWDGQGVLTVTAGGGGGMWTYSVVSATTDDDDRAIPSPDSCISLSTTDATTGSVNVACQVVILEPKLLGRWNYKYIIRATSVYNGTIADIELTFDCMPSY